MPLYAIQSHPWSRYSLLHSVTMIGDILPTYVGIIGSGETPQVLVLQASRFIIHHFFLSAVAGG
jgi:hypothetical protein